MVFFGIGALIPLIFVMLNFAGLLTGRRLLRAWRWLLIGCLTFAAVATPVAGPGHMLVVATPFMGIVMRRGGHHAAQRPAPRAGATSALGLGAWADDEASELPEQIVEPEDLVPSPLDDEPSAAAPTPAPRSAPSAPPRPDDDIT